MNSTIKRIFLGVVIFLTGACFGPQNTIVPNPADLEQKQKRFDDKRERDTDRDDVIRNTRSKYSGTACEDLTGRDQDDCEEICKDIYSGDRGARRECEELPEDLIEALEEVYELLEDANEDDFAGIDAELFDTYLNIGISGLEEIIEDYSNKDAEEFLYWLIEDEEIGEIFRKEDDDYQALESVFEQLTSNYDVEKVWEVFDEDIDGDELIELVINSSDEVIDWFMDYINDQNSACDEDTESKDCFEVYCRIGDIINRSDRDDWLRNETFEDYIEDIINEGTNSDNRGDQDQRGTGWTYGSDKSAGEFEELDNLSDDWVDDLCGGLV